MNIPPSIPHIPSYISPTPNRAGIRPPSFTHTTAQPPAQEGPRYVARTDFSITEPSTWMNRISRLFGDVGSFFQSTPPRVGATDEGNRNQLLSSLRGL